MNCRRRLYQTWYDMKNRCLKSDHKQWKSYGGRGIKICDRWLDLSTVATKTKPTSQGFLNFLEDMEATWFPGATIDRIDNDGDYTPENCRWVTNSENVRKEHQERVKNGTHTFLNGDIARNNNLRRVKNGTHPWLGPNHNKRRVEMGTHNLLGGVDVKRRVFNGTHHFLTNPPAKGTMWITNGILNKRIAKDQEIPIDYRRGVTRSISFVSNLSTIHL